MYEGLFRVRLAQQGLETPAGAGKRRIARFFEIRTQKKTLRHEGRKKNTHHVTLYMDKYRLLGKHIQVIILLHTLLA